MSGVDSAKATPGDEVKWLPSLRKGKEAWPVLLESLGQLYAGGMQVDWEGFDAPYSRKRVALPTYAFQRQRYWVDEARKGRAEPARPGRWLLSGYPLEVPGEVLHQVVPVGVARQPYLADHVVHGEVVVPGAFHLAVLLAIASDRFGASSASLREVQFIRPLVLAGETELPCCAASREGGLRLLGLNERRGT